ncbi:MAG: Ada metal-binding domain-containing protein [Chryseolinea sp.]
MIGYIDPEIRRLIKNGQILLAGNVRGGIYGKLNCWSGKKMKKENRVFFESELDAIKNGYRPCGHCMRGTCHAKINL